MRQALARGALLQRSLSQLLGPRLAPMAAVHTDACKASKKELRKELRAALKRLSEDDKVQQRYHLSSLRTGRAITQRLLDSKLFKDAKSVALYLTCASLNEVDTAELMHATLSHGNAKQLFVPMVEDKQSNMQFLHIGSLDDTSPIEPYNILQPDPTDAEGKSRANALDLPNGLDLMVMTGLAFDAQGRRLGRGGGYYDKFLFRCKALAEAQHRPPPLTVAIAFEDQLVHAVPATDDDYRMDVVLTASKLLQPSEHGRSSWQ